MADDLRAEIARALWPWMPYPSDTSSREAADAVLALPAVQEALAAADSIAPKSDQMNAEREKTSAGDGYVLMDGATFARLLDAWSNAS